MKGRKEKYNEGNLKSIVDTVVDFVRANPQSIHNPVWLKAAIAHNIPALNNHKECPNCGASMVQYEFVFDCLDAVLLLAMAKDVREAMNNPIGMTFTDANQVKVHHLPGLSYSIKSRTTQMSKLGLIAQCRTSNGKRIPGAWLITKRGWSAIRGEAVPKTVISWRNEIQERPGELITLSEAFKVHTDKIKDVLSRNKLPKTDYRRFFEDYEPESWVGWGEVSQGRLI